MTLIKRLRGLNEYWQHAPLYNEAADEIERLTARVEVLEEVCIEREADCIELEDENKRLTSENERWSAVIDAARNLSDGCTFPCDPIEGELHNRLDEALAKLQEKDDE